MLYVSLGELTINDSILRAYPKQRASISFRRLSFSSSRRHSSALPPRRANPCIGILSLVFAVGVFHYKMPFLPYEAFHSVRGCLQRTAAPKGQMICNDCCRHLLGLPLYLLTTITNVGCRTVTIQGAFNVGL